MDPHKEDAQDHGMFISLNGVLYVIVNSWSDIGKVLKELILKDVAPLCFGARIEETQEHLQAIQEQDNQIKAIQYGKVGLQDEIWAKNQEKTALQRGHVGYLANEDRKNGVTIIAKNNEEV